MAAARCNDTARPAPCAADVLFAFVQERMVPLKKKVVQSVSPTEDPLADFVAAIDVIESRLGIGTGQPTISEGLDGLLAELRRGAAGEEQLAILVDTTERLRWIEAFLADFWTAAPSKRAGA